MKSVVKKSMIVFLKLYKLTVSNYFYYTVLGGGCKYQKSCSEFAIEAVEKKGVLKGITLSLKRFLSCQPFSGKNYETISDFSR